MSFFQVVRLCRAVRLIFVIYIKPNNSHISKILGLIIPIFAIIIQESSEAQKTLSALVNRCATKERHANKRLVDIYRAASRDAAFRSFDYEGHHKFDVAMQEGAFRFLCEFLI